MMSPRYFVPIKRLGTAAIVSFMIGLIFPIISNALLSEEARKAVLVNAVPFFGFFIGILLLFVLLIVLVARRYNGKVPARTYGSIEQMIIAGILMGVICLFQPWSTVPYRYGFLLLLVATLGFILWSHTVPRAAKSEDLAAGLTTLQRIVSAISGLLVGLLLSIQSEAMIGLQAGLGLNLSLQPVHGFLLFVASLVCYVIWSRIAEAGSDDRLPSLGARQNAIGLVAGLVVLLVLTLAAVSANAPTEPYGVRDRVWKSYSDERKAAVASAALSDFQSVELPFLVIFNLFPASVVFFAVREAFAESEELVTLKVAPVVSAG
jgi:hypothetical protein